MLYKYNVETLENKHFQSFKAPLFHIHSEMTLHTEPETCDATWRACIARLRYVFGGDFPGGSDGKASADNAEDPGSIPGSGRSSGEGNGNPLQYSCLENPLDGGAW